MKICKAVTGYEKTEEGYVIHTNAADLRLIFVTEDCVRLCVRFPEEKEGRQTEVEKTQDTSLLEDASYILETVAWKDRLDPLFPERNHVRPAEASVSFQENEYVFKSKKLSVKIQREPFMVTVMDESGNVLYESVPGNGFMEDGNHRRTNYIRMVDDDAYYGFGEKNGPLNKHERLIRERGTDSWSYDPETCDSMYKQIPFYIVLNRHSKQATGIYYNNSYECVFNMGCEKSNYFGRYTYYQTDGGDLDVFILAGGSIAKVLDRYTMLTGRPALLPKRALGYQGSSMYYSELPKDCDAALENFVDMVRAKGFPIDGFHLSSGYTVQENNKRCVFTWNPERFPDPAAYFRAMNEKGAQNVPNVKPGVLKVHPMYEDFEKEGIFVKDSEHPEQTAICNWWGGLGAYFDYTNPRARALWKKHLTEQVIALGTNSVWDDNCEYDGLMDHDARVDYDGKGGTIGEFKSIMATLMCRLAWEAVKEHDPDARPYVVCRAGSAGIQKYAQTWVGDNVTSWRTLRGNIPTILDMGLSGQPNEGADIGGFAGPCPEEELFVRWVQHGIFQPRFSIHSANDDNTVTEPWMYRNSTERIRNAMLYRYRMVPHFYSLEYLAHTTGAPIMRPLVYEFQQDENCYDENYEFMLGHDLLIRNVLEPGVTTQAVYLPAGADWYDYEHSFKKYAGGQTITVPVTIDSIPRFIRSGAILPMADNPIYSMERDTVKKLHLILAPEEEESAVSEYVLYDDDGVSNDYEKGIYRKTTITMSGGAKVKVRFTSEGRYEDSVDSVFIELIHKEKAPVFVQLENQMLTHYLDREAFDNAESGWYYSETGRTAEIRYANPKKDCELLVSFEIFDLIGM